MPKPPNEAARRTLIEQLVRSAVLSNLIPATLSVPEASKLFNMPEHAIRAACDLGGLDCVRTEGGHRRIPLATLIDWMAGMREVVPGNDAYVPPASLANASR